MAIERLKQNREHMNQQHEENMEKIRHMTDSSAQGPGGPAVTWVATQLGKVGGLITPEPK